MIKLIKNILLLMPIPLVVFATTWMIDPANINNDDSYEAGVASILLSGKNVVNLVNYKERKLQQKIILGLSKAPEVIVIGSSRSMPISSAFFPGQSFLNNSVSGASIEDYLGIIDLYRRRGLMPKLVVIGLDPWVLNRNNDQTRWRDLYDEYVEMRSILGFTMSVQENLLNQMANYKKYLEFLSPAYFNQSYTELIQKGRSGKKYWPSDKSEAAEPMKIADGSYVYGKGMREKKVAEVNSEARTFAAGKPIYSLGEFNELDQPTMQMLDSLIVYLKKNNIRVQVYLAPYHPIAYAAIKTNASYAKVMEAEKWYDSLADKQQINLLGSFDPGALELEAADFYDGMHPRNEAVYKLFAGKTLQ